METVIITKFIYEQSDAPADLSGFFVPVHKEGNPRAHRLDIARLVASQVGEVAGSSVVMVDYHEHIVTQAEADGGDFTFDVPNIIEPTRSVFVYCNQLPLTYNKGYYIRGVKGDNNGVGTRQVTIRKNNADETYYTIKAGWPICVGYYYKIAIPGAIPESMVTLDSVTHQSPDNPALEYNAANDVKFILHFSNTGNAPESLNLHLQLVMSGTGGIIANQDITHSVPAGGNTYEITYKALGIVGSSQEYTLHVSGDRIDNDAVTVPAKTGTITLDLIGASRQTTTTVMCAVDFRNITSIFATKTAYVQLDSGTKIAITQSLGGMQHNQRFHTFADVVNANAHTVTLYDSDQTTVIETWPIAALTAQIPPGGGTTIQITDALNTWVMSTGYTAEGVFRIIGAFNQSIEHVGIEVGLGVHYDDDIARSQMKILDVPNIVSINQVILRFVDYGYPVDPAFFAGIQVHVHSKDLRYVQNYNDYHYAFVNNNIVLSTEIIPASDLGETEYRITLDGQYFEGISNGYKGLLFKATDESISKDIYIRLRQIQYIS